MKVLSATGLVKSYKRTTAVAGVSLTIAMPRALQPVGRLLPSTSASKPPAFCSTAGPCRGAWWPEARPEWR